MVLITQSDPGGHKNHQPQWNNRNLSRAEHQLPMSESCSVGCHRAKQALGNNFDLNRSFGFGAYTTLQNIFPVKHEFFLQAN